MRDFELHIRQVLCHADQIPFMPEKVGRHVEMIVAETDPEGLQRAIAKQNRLVLK